MDPKISLVPNETSTRDAARVSAVMSQASQKPVILIDGSSYIFRAFHALPPLTNSHGLPTGAIYGVVNMIRKITAEYQPDYMAVVFDAPGKTFRDEIYSEYKANRPPMPDDLRVQWEPTKAIISALGFPILEIGGVEADDVIGTLATHAANKNMQVIISTTDKDMAQLVNDNIVLANTMQGSIMDSVGVEKKFGVPPERIVDYLTLVGDSVDNIPGVPKVGPKTAAKWLQQYGSVDEIIDRSSEIRGKVGENLRSSLDHLPLSRTLATIRCDVELGCELDDLKVQDPNKTALEALYEEHEFNTWLKQLRSVDSDDSAQSIDDLSKPMAADNELYETIFTEEEFSSWLSKLEDADVFSFDTETTSLNYMDAKIVGVSMSLPTGEAAYIPVAHDYEGAPKQLPLEDVINRLTPLLEQSDKIKIMQNGKYDSHVLLNHGIRIEGIYYDTMLESYVLNSTATRHDMNSLAKKYLGRETIKFEDVAGKGAKQKTFNEVSIEAASPYAAEDAEITYALHNALWPKIRQKPKLRALYEGLEIPLMKVLRDIERNGVLIDTNMLKEQSKYLAKRMDEIKAKAHEVAGEKFNLSSPKQIQEILFNKLGIPVIEKTPKGAPSTAESVLQQLSDEYELPALILEFRGLSKLKSTYTDKLPDQVSKRTGRVHTSYHQAVAATGRLSSSDPNLQNIPIKSEEGRRIRKAFIASPGYYLLAADYSQIELRIMAHLSNDSGLVNAFAQGIDVHAATASEIFETDVKDVTREQRRAAKAVNFGLIYGMSAFGLAKQLKVERHVAQEYIDKYFMQYPGVKAYMDRTRMSAHENHFVETIYGRRLYLPEINSRNAQRRQYAERTAINAPMQGSAADIIKLAMLSVDEWVQEFEVDVRMVMQVHDELVFEVPENQVVGAAAQIRWHMEQVSELKVPLIVDVGYGKNWDEAH